MRVDSCSEIIILFIQFSKNVSLLLRRIECARWQHGGLTCKILPRISLLYLCRPDGGGFRRFNGLIPPRETSHWTRMHFFPTPACCFNITYIVYNRRTNTHNMAHHFFAIGHKRILAECTCRPPCRRAKISAERKGSHFKRAHKGKRELVGTQLYYG